jgi:hypothetical protein
MPGKPDLIVRELLDRYGCPYAEQAGIRLADRPVPLYQLLVLSTLLTARIRPTSRSRPPASCPRPGTAALAR